MKQKEWLLLNAIECWLYYCDDAIEYAQQYRDLREEYRELVAALDSKDAPKVVAPKKPTRTTRSRTTKSTK